MVVALTAVRKGSAITKQLYSQQTLRQTIISTLMKTHITIVHKSHESD